MDFINLVSTYRHGTPKITGTETPSSQAFWTYFVVFMCISPVPIIILARLLSILSGRYCKNYLPRLGFALLLHVCVDILSGPPRGAWSTIHTVLKRRIEAHLRTLHALQQDTKNEIRLELSLHSVQAADIADWAVVPQAVIRDRINRRKTILMLQKEATIVRIRREIYSRALGYIDTVAERKRGQSISRRDLFLASCIYTYCVFLWFFELAFASIWGVLSWFELALVYMTEPRG